MQDIRRIKTRERLKIMFNLIRQYKTCAYFQGKHRFEATEVDNAQINDERNEI